MSCLQCRHGLICLIVLVFNVSSVFPVSLSPMSFLKCLQCPPMSGLHCLLWNHNVPNLCYSSLCSYYRTTLFHKWLPTFPCIVSMHVQIKFFTPLVSFITNPHNPPMSDVYSMYYDKFHPPRRPGDPFGSHSVMRCTCATETPILLTLP